MKRLKVLIVDDENLAIEYLRNIIPWSEYGYDIVGGATDAMQAMQLFVKFSPNIVISDINMPGINGLEFCSNIIAKDPSVKILLLTAYKEFEYAKKAIGLGVSNYLLKHDLNEKTLIKELEKVREELNKQELKNSIVKKHIIMNFMEEIEDMVDNAGLEWNSLESRNGTFILMVLKIDAPYRILNIEGLSYREFQEPDRSIYEEIQDDFCYVDSFKLRNQMWAVLYSLKGYLSEASLWHGFYPIALKIKDAFERASGYQYSVYIEMRKQEIKNITKMHNNSIAAFEHIPFIGKSRIIRRQDIPLPLKEPKLEAEAAGLLQDISAALAEQDMEKISKNLQKLFIGTIQKSKSPKLLRKCNDELIRMINIWREKSFLPAIQDDGEMDYIQLGSFYTVNEIMNLHQRIFTQSIESAMDLKYGKYSKKIQKAIQYLHKYYAQDISVLDIANAIEISESNLSRMFKSETGFSILEYLTAIRMDEAKKLLKKGNFKIYEISEMVGYKTSQYFSQVFIRTTGLHPQTFREEAKFGNDL